MPQRELSAEHRAGPELLSLFTKELDADSVAVNKPRQVKAAAFSRVMPKEFQNPSLAVWNTALANEIGITLTEDDTQYLSEIFAGQQLLKGSDPYAMAYGGHQFGNWAGQLGDGRAIALGEVALSDGSFQTLQLKGAGPTPYSRRGDGLAVLRSSIREYLASEAMYHLGVPTSRALSLVLTGDEVMRDMLYDGNPELEPGAIVCRTAPSFIRFGNFQLFASRGEVDQLRKLADFTIRHYFGHLDNSENPNPETYLEWFNEVRTTTATLMVEWLRVGFVHGVVNTDNLSVHGITIDYGPYGWIDDFDPTWTPNTTDAANRRYRFGNQGAVGQWNLLQLANALVPLVEDVAELEKSVNEYVSVFTQQHQTMMMTKIGLTEDGTRDAADGELVQELLQTLTLTETDMTIFYRRLAGVTHATKDPISVVNDAYYDQSALTGDIRSQIETWMKKYQNRLSGIDNDGRVKLMNSANPVYVLRNYLAQEVIDAATEGDFSPMKHLQTVLERPYEPQNGQGKYAEKRPDWAKDRVGCSKLSCSS